MTKQEFLHELQIALQGELDQAAINENVKYYDNYIREEARKGQSEEEVTARLGNPRLIAKTLIDTTGKFGNYEGSQYYSEDYRQRNETSGRGFRADYSEQEGWDVRFGGLKLNSWYGKLLLILAAVLIIVIVANVVAFLLPILVPVILILLLYSLFFGGRR
ncbi:DUF1700 domain-containing protein [Lachnospiraceae bacterium KK002]